MFKKEMVSKWQEEQLKLQIQEWEKRHEALEREQQQEREQNRSNNMRI